MSTSIIERSLKMLIEELKDRVSQLISFDYAEEINAHCDNLTSQVTMTVQSNIDHLSQLEADLHRHIEEFRRDRLAALLTQEFKEQIAANQLELDALFRASNELYFQQSGCFDQPALSASQSQIQSALDQANDLTFKASLYWSKLKRDAFNKRFLSFYANQRFLLSQNHVGILSEFQNDNSRVIDHRFVRSLRGHKGHVTAVVFVDNETLATASDDSIIKLWSLSKEKLLFELNGHLCSVLCLALLPNGWLASGSLDKSIRLWDLDERKLLRTMQGHLYGVYSLKVLPNGQLASQSWENTIKIWNPCSSDDSLVHTIAENQNVCALSIGILSNGFLVSSSRSIDNTVLHINVWNPCSAKLVKSFQYEAKFACSSLVLSNDSVAVGFNDGSLAVFSLFEKSKCIVGSQIHIGGISSLVQLPDGLLLSGNKNYSPEILVWNPENGRLIQTIRIEHKSYIASLTVSLDGKYVASGSWDSTSKVISLSF